MKQYEAKTLEECLALASEELALPVEKLSSRYKVVSESKGGLFKKKTVSIEVYEASDVPQFAIDYVKHIIETLGLSAEFSVKEEDGVYHIEMESEDAAKIIGRGGDTLRALNELVRSAVYVHFGEHYHILLNINSYKDQKYQKLVRLAENLAKTVKRTRRAVELDPMPSDERRVIHNALTGDPHIKTLSIGVGRERRITIQYVNVVPKLEDEEN